MLTFPSTGLLPSHGGEGGGPNILNEMTVNVLYPILGTW